MLSRSCLQELELISTSAELLAAQCHFITFLIHILAKINKYVDVKNTSFCLALGKKNPNQQTTKPKSRAVIPHFVNSSNISQTFLDVQLPWWCQREPLDKRIFCSSLSEDYPITYAVSFDYCFRVFLKCLIWDLALFLKHSTIYYWEISGSNILGSSLSLSYTNHGKTEKKKAIGQYRLWSILCQQKESENTSPYFPYVYSLCLFLCVL